MVNYSIVYGPYTWTVIDSNTGNGIVCFPTQIGAANWIKLNTIKTN